MTKEKVVAYESSNSICYKCNVQIGAGNKYEWVTVSDGKYEKYKMAHPNCKEGKKQDMNISCFKCGNKAISTNAAGNWVCEKHSVEEPKNKKISMQDLDLNAIAQEIKKYITLDDLEKIIEVRKKLDAINITDIIDTMDEKEEKITHAIKNINNQVEHIENIVAEQKKKIIPKIINIKVYDKEFSTIGKHAKYPELLTYIVNRKDVFLNGPAGAGKNTAVEQAAKELEMPLHVQQLSQLSLKSELTGYKNIVNDNFIPTSFTVAYENGGIFFADEFDNWAPSVVTSVNMAIANNFYAFPKGTIHRHKDFVFIAAGNTIGLGAESHYVTSRALSGASRDRFRFLYWPIDEVLEKDIISKEYHHWVEFVQECRKLSNHNGATILITPRASIQGAQDLAMGFSKQHIIDAVLLRNITTPSYLVDIIKRYINEG